MRNNDLEANQAQQAETTHLIHELLQEGQVRQYGRRYLITRLARQHGHRAQGQHVRQALQILDNHNMTLCTPGMRRKRQENYTVPGPDWLWCLDGHDKLARYGIEIYGCVDAYSCKIVWFYVGVSNSTQVISTTTPFRMKPLTLSASRIATYLGRVQGTSRPRATDTSINETS